MNETDRFWSKVFKTDTCWLWTAAVQRGRGYGRFRAEGRLVLAHRYAYETLVGPVPDGLQLDHLCTNKACVNPDHLEPVTGAVNMRRAADAGLLTPAADARRGHKAECPHGHPYEGDNLIIGSDGKRRCRTCSRRRGR